MSGGLVWLVQNWKLNFHCILFLSKCEITYSTHLLIKGQDGTTTLIKTEIKNLTIDCLI